MDLNDLPTKAGPALVFMLAIWFLTLLIRRVAEQIWPQIANKGTWWENVALPSMPYVLGAGIATEMHKFPGLSELPTPGTRAMYGLVAGALSGLVYRIVKAVAKKKYGVELSMPPDAVAGAQVIVNVPENQLPKLDVHYTDKKENESLPDSQKETDPGIDQKGEAP